MCVHMSVCACMDNPRTGYTAFMRFSQWFMNNGSLRLLQHVRQTVKVSLRYEKNPQDLIIN